MEHSYDDKALQLSKKLISVIHSLITVLLFILVGLVVLVGTMLFGNFSGTISSNVSESKQAEVLPTVNKEATNYWMAPDITSLAGTEQDALIKYGKELITNTSKYLGPKGSVKQITNGMNCQNCHLEAGSKIFGNNYGAVYANYPRYRARSGSEEDIYKRVNDCMERSLNGKPLKNDSREMQAITAYINWLGKDVSKGTQPEGSGVYNLTYLDRAADPEKGRVVYEAKCQSCHQANGEGVMNSDGIAYSYPPLWGKNSYNIGAGLYRISRFAGYVKYNMPLGASHEFTMLTDEEAWDVAAFVNSQPRPEKDLSKDWPKIEEKPVDHPFGPFADGFSETQHKYGPFEPIKKKLKELKEAKSVAKI
jgi:thiosulfate dehydrogenase